MYKFMGARTYERAIAHQSIGARFSSTFTETPLIEISISFQSVIPS